MKRIPQPPTGTVTQLQLFLDATAAAAQVQVGLYADSAGHPGSLLSSGVISRPLAGAHLLFTQEFDRAHKLQTDSLDVAPTGDVFTRWLGLANLGDLARLQGQYERAYTESRT